MNSGPTPPFRADHVGSLLRPAPLLAARAEHEKGWITAETLRRVEEDAIRRAAAMQTELGLQGGTDGEVRRAASHMDFLYQIGEGVKTDRVLPLQFKNEAR